MTRPTGHMAALIAEQGRAQRRSLMIAAGAGGVVSAAAVGLLGLSGWFIVGAALAGGAGTAVAQSFNYLVPSAVIRLLAILRTGARYVERVAGHDAGLYALARLRPEVLDRFAGGRPDSVLRVAAGDAAGRLVQDIDALQIRFIRQSAPWAMGAGTVMAVCLTWLAHPFAAMTTAAFMALAAATNWLLAERLAAPVGREMQRAAGDFRGRLAALEAAAPELKAYGLAAWAVTEIDAVAAPMDRAAARATEAGGWMVAAQMIVTGLAVIAVVVAAREASTPLIALAALATITGIEAATGLAAAFRQDGAAREAVERLDGLMSGTSAQEGENPAGVGIAIDATSEALSPPARLAISGPSGCGKTTLIEELIGQRSGPAGGWRLDGKAPRDLAPAAVRSFFSYAAQDVRLLDGSVRENLRLADPDASDASLWAALDDAVLADRVRASPLGLDMAIGPNGHGLSGGERRRLSLARAYLRSAPWLVLDEPTESLDAVTEALVLERLDRRLKARRQGLILISHRPAPLALCKRLLRIDRPSLTAPDARRQGASLPVA